MTIEVQLEGLKEFIEEMVPQIADSEAKILSWTSDDADPDTANYLFRTFHNVKGTCGMFGLSLLAEIFHNGESLLAVIREKKLKPSDEVGALLLEVLDSFKTLCTYTLENGKEPSDKPYALMGKLQEHRALYQNADKNNEQGAAAAGVKNSAQADDTIRISSQQGNELVEIISDFIQLQNRLDVSLGSDGSSSALKNDISRFSGRLQNFVLGIRLAPIMPLLQGLQRTAQAAGRELNKKFRMQITGGDTQLDRRVLELLRDPLVHMIRNSMDHGLEAPEQRMSVQKTPEGLIVIEAYQQSGQVILTISDDGKGIDAERIKKKALEKQLITADEAASMSHAAALKLIFLPGFSTAEKVTNFSGRGVGMDAVKTSVESIGGVVDVESELGRGSKITLTLPLTLAIVKSLAFKVGKQMYAVPQICVEEVLTSTTAKNRNQISELALGKKVLHLRKNVVPIISIANVFELTSEVRESVFVVIRHRSHRFALEVDRIMGPRDFVAQPMPSVAANVNAISGVNQINSGEYIALLDLASFGSLIEQSGETQNQSPNYNISTSEHQDVSDIFRSQQKLLFFKCGKLLGIPVQAIRQVVHIHAQNIDSVGDRMFVTHESKTYPVLQLSKRYTNEALKKQLNYTGLLVAREGKNAIILCEEFHGIHRLPAEFESMVKAPGIQGSVNHEGKTYLVANVKQIFSLEFPEQFSTRSNSSKAFRVLIAEDDSFFAASLSDFLRHEGVEVVHSRDGQEAKEYLESTIRESTDQTDTIDYVITDLEMPRMSGMELLRWIRENQQLAHLPVTMCTAVGDELAKRTAQKLGIEFFAGKMKYEEILPYIIKRQRGSEIGVTSDMTLEANKSGEDGDNRRILSFRVGDKHYAIDIHHLKEISSAFVSTTIPGLHECVNQMIGFRGHPIPVLDLRILDGKGKVSASPQQIVSKFGDYMCALWVDEVLNVRRAHKMDKASGILKSSGLGSLSSIVGDILWDQNEAFALLSETRIEKLLQFVKLKTQTLEAIYKKEAA